MALVQSIEYPPSLSSPISLSFPRSRDAFTSSGRGGSGNIRRASVGREARPSVDVHSSPACREIEPSPSTSRYVSVGRGGKGNLQPPSPPPDLATHPMTAAIVSQHKESESRREEQVRRHHAESRIVSSSGRGGSGNINNNRRSKSRPPSSGRKASKNPEHSIIDTLHLIRPKGLANLKLSSRTKGTSRTRAESIEDPLCSPTAPHNAPEKRRKRKHSFLKPWNKSSLPPPPSPPPPSLPDRIRVSTATEGSCQVVFDSSSENSDLLQVDARRNSRGAASMISACSSGSGSLFSSQMSTQSLPVLPEDREHDSWAFLEDICSRYTPISMEDDYY